MEGEKFTVLDDIGFWHRTALLILCGLTCCWGFENNTILLVFAGKIGFPLAVTACATSSNVKQIINMMYYTLLLIIVGILYFTFNETEIDYFIVKNYTPTITDFILAIGLGGALSVFWNHQIRINVIILSAALASLLPACILAGYFISWNMPYHTFESLALYAQYVIGISLGARLFKGFTL